MYNRKKQLEPIPEENTKVWICETDGCNSWMREDFAFDVQPSCAICSGTMSIGEKMLPTLSNTTG